MKILVYADPHYCDYSSIVRGQGKTYSIRLENVIQSVNWAHDIAKTENCDLIVCLGDFFDSSTLNAQELSALASIDFDVGIPVHFLVGNHELSTKESRFNSQSALSLHKNISVMKNPCVLSHEDVQLCYLPYQFDTIKLSDVNIFKHLPKSDGKRIMFSHNDLLGYNYGKFISRSGVDMSEIDSYCDIYLNGHLHNGEQITDKIINVGNLTGLNFSEDAEKYSHKVYIVDTNSMGYESIENPYAMNFYKIDINKEFPTIKQNAVITAKIDEKHFDDLIRSIKENNNIIDYRIILQQSNEHDKVKSIDFSINHLDEFRKYIKETMGDSDYVLQELAEVCK